MRWHGATDGRRTAAAMQRPTTARLFGETLGPYSPRALDATAMPQYAPAKRRLDTHYALCTGDPALTGCQRSQLHFRFEFFGVPTATVVGFIYFVI